MDSTEAHAQSHVPTWGHSRTKPLPRALGSAEDADRDQAATSEPQSRHTQTMPPIAWTSAPAAQDASRAGHAWMCCCEMSKISKIGGRLLKRVFDFHLAPALAPSILGTRVHFLRAASGNQPSGWKAL